MPRASMLAAFSASTCRLHSLRYARRTCCSPKQANTIWRFSLAADSNRLGAAATSAAPARKVPCEPRAGGSGGSAEWCRQHGMAHAERSARKSSTHLRRCAGDAPPAGDVHANGDESVLPASFKPHRPDTCGDSFGYPADRRHLPSCADKTLATLQHTTAWHWLGVPEAASYASARPASLSRLHSPITSAASGRRPGPGRRQTTAQSPR